MRLITNLVAFGAAALSLGAHVAAQADAQAASNQVGYYTNFSTLPNNNTFNFGRHYAVLNLDLQELIVGPLRKSNSTAGKQFINATATWIDAVNSLNPKPLSVFSRIAPVNAKEVDLGGPTKGVFASLNLTGPDDPRLKIAPEFKVVEGDDVVVSKTRYYAGAGNALETVLRAQGINTVIISGVRTSGVVLATASRLIDMDYFVYVIVDNCLESPPAGPSIDRVIKEGILPKIPANVITLEQALAALKRSGPAVY